jgi:hypothetical protein
MYSKSRVGRSHPPVHDIRILEETLAREITRLEHQLDVISSDGCGTRLTVANTYRDMIESRKELLTVIRRRTELASSQHENVA